MTSPIPQDQVGPLVGRGDASVRVLPGIGVIGEDVTEFPGHQVTPEQITMLHTRYHLAVRLADGKDVLELACGSGVGLGCLAHRARRVVGGDLNPQAIEFAARHYGPRVEVREVDAQNLPFADAAFDVIVFLDSIYWLPQPRKFVDEAKRVLRPGGVIFISTWSPMNVTPLSKP